MKLQVLDATGTSVEEIDADDAVFGIEPNEPVVHQTLLAQLAARRSGSANTKSRGEVKGSTRKLRRQKGLGMARVGSANSPIRRGGGVAFGPKQRSYVQKLPKRMRRLAIRSVLSSRVADGRLKVMSDFGLDLYGNAIIVNPEFAAAEAAAVRAFLRATVRGYQQTKTAWIDLA